MKRFTKHLRAHVVGYTALFIVLGGTAVALPGKGVVDKNDLGKNVVKSKNIAGNAVKGVDVKEGSLDFACPAGKKEAIGSCWDAAPSTITDTWESTFTDCVNKGGWLPSLAELAAAAGPLGLPATTPDLWAGQNWEDGGERASALDLSTLIPQRQNASNSHAFICQYPLVRK